MSERSPEFSTSVQREKQARIGNLTAINWYDPTDLARIGDINPDSIRDYLKSKGKKSAEIEWQFPSLKIQSNPEDIIAAIMRLGENQPPKSPQDLMDRIGKVLRSNMSYNLAQVLFTKPENSDYPDMVRRALLDPNAKYAMSTFDTARLNDLTINIEANPDMIRYINRTGTVVRSAPNFSQKEIGLVRTLGSRANDANWLRDVAVNNSNMQALFQKITTRYGYLLYGTQHSTGTLHANQDATRDIYETLAGVRVWVCRDFAMMAKQIYAEIAPKYFPDSEVLYVLNHEKRHAYNVLMYERDGQVVKEHYDPTSLILGGSFRVREGDGMHGDKNEVWANANTSAGDNTDAVV